MPRVLPSAALASLLVVVGCRDLSSFSTNGDHFEGMVVPGDFVRAGIDATTSACLTLDADHLQDMPGSFSTDDGRFHAVDLRPIPQIWHDPLSTLSFGEGRLKNLLYMATPTAPFGDARADDAMVVVSLMQGGDVEIRLLRGAPSLGATAVDASAGASVDAAAPPPAAASPNLFAVFDLTRKPGPCSY